jgi:SAM-dependent methyltransferase
VTTDPAAPRLRIPPQPDEPRTPDRLRAHYEVERELADRLRAADRETRARLYAEVYDELYRRVPDHPQLRSKVDARARRAMLEDQIGVLRGFLGPDATFMEIGAGDCALCVALAPSVRRVIAVEVSDEVSKGVPPLPNFSLVLSDGQSVPVPPESVSVAYSNQVMEHLHPDDARAQLAGIRAALAPGGVYVCITPNRIAGPHDISKYFDRIATGFHLKEYTVGELAALMREAGFSRVAAIVGARGRFVRVPAAWMSALEGLLMLLPEGLRRRAMRLPVLRNQLSIRLAAHR